MYSIIKEDNKINQQTLDEWANRESKPRDYLWASEIGKSHFDIYHKMIGTKPDNPITLEGLKKMKAGELFEEAFVSDLRNKGVKFTAQEKIELPETKDRLKITGKIDVEIELPDENVPIEVKSVNSRAFWYTEKQDGGNWYKGFYVSYYMQLLTYIIAKNANYGLLIFISRDDTTKAEIILQNKENGLRRDWDKWIKEITHYIREGIEPPKPPLMVEGKKYNRSTRKYDIIKQPNKMIEFSNYRELIVGMPWEEYIKTI